VEWAFGVSLNTSEITCGFDRAHCSPHGQFSEKDLEQASCNV
jgi:hypothetical protein